MRGTRSTEKLFVVWYSDYSFHDVSISAVNVRIMYLTDTLSSRKGFRFSSSS